MKVKERHFPYPILANFSDDFKKGSYETDISYTVNPSMFILTVKHSVDNQELKELISNGDAVYTTHIECSKTQTRILDSSSNNDQKINIDAKKIENRIEVCTFIVATKRIDNYFNSNFDEDYYDYNFTVNKGDILAIGYDYNVNIEKKKVNNSESIIQFEKAKNGNKQPIKINYDSNRLFVILNEKNYSTYTSLIDHEELHSIFHSIIGVPVIASALQVIGSEVVEPDDSDGGYSDYRWYKVLIEKIEIIGKDPYDPNIYEDSGVFLLAQQILDDPLTKSLDSLLNIYDDNTSEEDYE